MITSQITNFNSYSVINVNLNCDRTDTITHKVSLIMDGLYWKYPNSITLIYKNV